MTATYDIGRAAARQLLQPDVWLGRTMDVVSWKGTLAEMALALEKVGGVPVKAGLAMSLLARRFFLNDLHQMCLYFDAGKVIDYLFIYLFYSAFFCLFYFYFFLYFLYFLSFFFYCSFILSFPLFLA
ncbi:hypothetical protein T492DRAFT_283317 [Pavlovales sp. CCMP2436]|nr:hypothetical protein T492DRAFT_283317 [Pavlovales sp. CCMP2436]